MATALLSFGNTCSDTRIDRCLWYMGAFLNIHSDSQDSNGQFTLMEASVTPGTEPPMHIHAKEDELLYVLEGQLKVFRGEEELILEAGDSGFLPRHIPHSFKVLSSHARLLVYMTPGGFEGFFRELGQPAAAPRSAMPKLKAPPLTKMISVAEQYGLTFLP